MIVNLHDVWVATIVVCFLGFIWVICDLNCPLNGTAVLSQLNEWLSRICNTAGSGAAKQMNLILSFLVRMFRQRNACVLYQSQRR